MQENFDLFESTIQVVENRDFAKEEHSSRLDVLKNYEDYKNEFKENLQVLQVSNCENKEIIEANKFMKQKFQQDSLNVRSCFHQIFGYIAEINKATQKIEKVRDSISTTYEDNERLFYNLSKSVENTIKESSLAVKRDIDIVLAEKIELERELETIDTNHAIERENWELSSQHFDEERECLLRIELECEVLRDNITENNELYKQASKLRQSKYMEIVQKNSNLRKQLAEVVDCKSDAQISLNEQFQKLAGSKHMLAEINHKINTTERTLEKTNDIFEKKCKEIETIPKNVNELLDQISTIKSKQVTSLEKRRGELVFIKKQGCEKSEMYENLIIKLDEVNTENNETIRKQETIASELNNLIKTRQIATEKGQVQKQEIENYIKLTQASGTEIKLKIRDLEILTNKQNDMILLQESNIKTSEIEQKNIENEKNNIDKKIQKNKELQKSLDELKELIDKSANQVTTLTKERDENAEKVSKLKHKCDFLNKEFKKREDIVESVKSSKASFSANKKPNKETNFKQRKRGIDYGSDSSSLDGGERLSYAEFMARKAAVENKMLSRSNKKK